MSDEIDQPFLTSIGLPRRTRKGSPGVLTGFVLCLSITLPINGTACGWGGENDNDDEIEEIVIGADGNPISESSSQFTTAAFQNGMGNRHRTGDGAARDDEEAARWYRMAAERGYAPAQNNLASMYEQGLGISQSEESAARWFRLAAAQGNAPAQHSLGQMYLDGRGVARDLAEGARWLLRSAEQGHRSAMRQLGTLYWNGRGVSKNDLHAYRWWKAAASQGDEVSAKQLESAVRELPPDKVIDAENLFVDTTLPQGKRTVLRLYLTARQAYAKLQERPDAYRILDVRTPGEYVFVGHARDAYNIPIKFLETRWDPSGKRPGMRLNESFVSDVQSRFSKTDTIFVICRSGTRSALAVDLMARAGFEKLYSVTDGFEGDTRKDVSSPDHGKRIINGWKNSGAPWTYALDPEFMYLPSKG